MKFICAACGDGDHGTSRGGNWCDCQHTFKGLVHEQIYETWRVLDADGEVVTLTNFDGVAFERAALVPGSTVEYRKTTRIVTPWRVVNQVPLPTMRADTSA